ncbi:hypothetical protein J6590_071381 [Homalodisca vitripennis]|nr:hypothetical protein J6590_071381 [Homalodisca vitripennis]
MPDIREHASVYERVSCEAEISAVFCSSRSEDISPNWFAQVIGLNRATPAHYYQELLHSTLHGISRQLSLLKAFLPLSPSGHTGISLALSSGHDTGSIGPPCELRAQAQNTRTVQACLILTGVQHKQAERHAM